MSAPHLSTRGMLKERTVRDRAGTRSGMRTHRPRFLSQHDGHLGEAPSPSAVAIPPDSGVHAVGMDGGVDGGVAEASGIRARVAVPGTSPVIGPPQKEQGAGMNFVEQVTLIVYGWKNVEPGTLSWVFPSLTAALAAARTMTNAVRWSIVAGSRDADVDVDEERLHGAVLVEQAS